LIDERAVAVQSPVGAADDARRVRQPLLLTLLTGGFAPFGGGLAVGEGDARTVRRPCETADTTLLQVRDWARLAPVGGDHINLRLRLLAAADERDLLTIGRPARLRIAPLAVGERLGFLANPHAPQVRKVFVFLGINPLVDKHHLLAIGRNLRAGEQLDTEQVIDSDCALHRVASTRGIRGAGADSCLSCRRLHKRAGKRCDEKAPRYASEPSDGLLGRLWLAVGEFPHALLADKP
jgi:hypothetical protein